MYLKRDIEKTILDAETSFQAIVIYGARQVGKSTTVDALFGNRFASVTLDDANERELALTNPKGFLEVHPWPLIVYEVQKAPNLLSEIKIAIDEQRKTWLKSNHPRQLMYVLTGSNQFELQAGISRIALSTPLCPRPIAGYELQEDSHHPSFRFVALSSFPQAIQGRDVMLSSRGPLRFKATQSPFVRRRLCGQFQGGTFVAICKPRRHPRRL